MTDQTTDPFETKTDQPKDIFADQLNSIVNESGKPKYESVEKALEALSHSQKFIPELKSKLDTAIAENERLKKELSERKGVDEMIQSWQSTTNKEEGKQGDQPVVPSVDVKTVEQMVADILNKNTAEKQEQENVSAVQKSLIQKYGDKASEVIAKKAVDLNTTPDALKTLSKTNPALVLQLFDAKTQQTTITNSSVVIPPNKNNDSDELKRPEKSLLRGATARDQAEYMKAIRAKVYKDFNVET